MASQLTFGQYPSLRWLGRKFQGIPSPPTEGDDRQRFKEASDRTLVATSIVFDGETYRQMGRDVELDSIGCLWRLGCSRVLKNRAGTIMVVVVDWAMAD